MVSLSGILTYRARADGSPSSVINRARGTYTELPAAGDKADCGDVLYRVDEHPVLLLCGTVPAYRDLHAGDDGQGRVAAQPQPAQARLPRRAGAVFTPRTERALSRRSSTARAWRRRAGSAPATRSSCPQAVRIAKVTGELGGAARPGAQVAQATSDTLGVQVDLDPSAAGRGEAGDRARITLPGIKTVNGRVARLGRVAESAGKDGGAADATIPASVTPRRSVEGARARPGARSRWTSRPGGWTSALSVPVTALVGRSGGGFAVEVVRAGGRRELVAVKLGLFDRHGRTRPGRGRSRRGRRRGGAVAVSETVLELDGVTKVYGEQPPVAALRGVSFSVRRRRAGGDRRALRVGQVHAPAHHGDAGAAQQRRGPDRWGRRGAAERPRAVAAAGPGDRVRLPAVLPGRARHRARERRRRLALRRRPRRRAVPARGRGARTGRPLRPRDVQAHQALRRGAPAGGDRPGARRAAGDRARRRADREPRQHHRRVDHGAHPRAQRAPAPRSS